MSSYYDLGDHRRAISTSSPAAQRWFDRGLNWTYGFNHGEAVRCFRRALETDPDCPMAYWGIAYASGPNYNKPWEAFTEADLARTVSKVYDATQQAVALLDKASPAERALITALQSRYPAPVPAEDCSTWNDDYACAMRAVYRDHGDDLDVAALFAEALMNRTPWQLWNLGSGEPAEGAGTIEAMEVLERAFENRASRKHPGILHMYIHLMEMSPFPERAMQAADWLRGLVPDAGHLEHMPTHIDVLCGQYHDVVADNTRAIEADNIYLEREGAMNFYTLYRVHNFHFKLYGAMFLGQSEIALRTADEVIATIPKALLERQVPPMADWLEGFMPVKMHVLIRFGKWQEIIDTPLPENQELYCVTTAMIHYAKGVAFSATGRVAEAEEEQTAVRCGGQPRSRHPLPLQQSVPRHSGDRGRDAGR